MTLVYDELRAVARRQLRRWRPGQTLDTTALVHEAYLRLVDQAGASWQDRVHFLSVAGVAMRHILVDAARRRVAKKRGGEGLRISLDELGPDLGGTDASLQVVEILDLDEALTSLAARNERLSRLVELRFFAGLREEETAQTLGISERKGATGSRPAPSSSIPCAAHLFGGARASPSRCPAQAWSNVC
jgi:RNA polymerase sigma factor (TIGR02999 family)